MGKESISVAFSTSARVSRPSCALTGTTPRAGLHLQTSSRAAAGHHNHTDVPGPGLRVMSYQIKEALSPRQHLGAQAQIIA
ncbi:unnamed protein product [Lota lota]